MEFSRFALAMVGHFLASLLYVLRRLHILDGAVVDTSSILEHREELRELWEKRMMADDNQSSPSSTAVAEKSNCKPSPEEGAEEEVVKKTSSESEASDHNKLSNGHVTKTVDDSDATEIGNTNHAQEKEVEIVHSSEPQMATQKVESDQDNNNCADSLEEDNVEEYVEEKTYTSQLETSLVMKKTSEETTNVVHTATEEVNVTEETVVTSESVSQATVLAATVEEVDGKADVPSEPATNEVTDNVPPVKQEDEHEEMVPEERGNEDVKECVQETSENMVAQEELLITATKSEETHEKHEVVESIVDDNPKILEFETRHDDNADDDGFVRVEECLPKVENAEDVHDSEEKSAEQDSVIEQKPEIVNGHAELSETMAVTSSTPEPALEDRANNPEMEQFVKSGGVKRILPGVQKTEQPYSTCTTETKIAMEIREMREREEELRQMREQALLSPVVSPVPPKSPSIRSPSPSIKEAPSPTPSTGCGYRVSSVFGHKGTTSPSPPVVADEERKGLPFKGINKESAVEKEIRLARDREEELRKQKGLPPREDDSYVKPSQVKSSQVRVFGKMAGANNAVKQAATAKIQMEIEEQTQREMALRETGSIQTISQERTDAKVAKLKTPDPPSPQITNGNSHPVTNGNHVNGRSSPDAVPYKRGSPSPTGARPAAIFSPSNCKSNISMHKFIASKGKETTFAAPRNGMPFVPKEENGIRGSVAAPMVKLKRNVSVESKIQQEILEMKQREEELKMLHMNKNGGSSPTDDNSIEHEMNQKNNLMEYQNGNDLNEEDISPRHNKLIAQWEQMIQKAES